ncbi:uncharacterized protein ACWYII_020663 isoform 1-T2 [Salvelinus alpinus]
MSRLAFMRILEQRTDYFGRNGMICGDTFQKSFFEWTYCRSEIDQVCDIQYFDCPACSPSMLAVSVDGNKKLYRFKKGTDDKGFFDGVFICKDEDVSDFVNYVHTKTKHGYGKGVCGASQWTAAKESSRKTNNKLDEEGLEVAVCRHGILLRSLNMMRGEIFAYPLFLQKELSGSRNIQFMCTDVICKFWPYLTKVALHCPELATLLDMKPLLSVMHAKAHRLKCEIKWGGRNQEGAGTTLGEEVEQGNSFLSRAAICSKQMSKGARTDMLTIQAMGWNRRKKNNLHRVLSRRYLKTTAKILEETQTLKKFKSDLGVGDETLYNWTTEVQQWANTEETNMNMDGPQVLQRTIEVLFLSIKQRKRNLYRQTDGCKKRHPLRRKILEEKAKLTAAIEEYNTLVRDSAIPSADEILSADLHAWPWELHGQTDLLTKKIAFDRVMLLRRLKEEELIVLKEVKQHWESLKRESQNVQDLASHVALDLSRKSCQLNQSEAGSRGLFSMLQRRVSSLRRHQDSVKLIYSKAMGQDTSLLEDNFIDDLLEEDLDDIYDSVHYSSDDEESITD